MKIKVLLCNCKGLCGSFKANDFNTLPFEIESEVAQEKLFRRVLRATGFPAERFAGVDIRMTDNEGVIERVRGKVEELRQKVAA